MDIRQLKVIETVWRTGSITAAARALNVSQPAISKTVKQVEEATGLALFEHIQGRIIPSAQTSALVPSIERLLATFEGVKRDVEYLRSGQRGLVKIATTAATTALFLGEAIALFRKNHPLVDLDINISNTLESIEQVGRHEVDFALSLLPSSGFSDVIAEKVVEGRAVCVMPMDHRLAGNQTISPSDLIDENVISYPDHGQAGALIAAVFTSTGARLQRTISLNQGFAACALVSQGAGIAVIDSFSCTVENFRSLAIRPIAPTITIPGHLVISSVRPLSLLAEEFCNAVRQAGRAYEDRWAGI